MASPPLLDFPALLAPIPGPNAAGDSIPFAVREKFEEGRKEENPDDYKPDDPQRPAVAKKADWAGIAKLASETLRGTAKDLQSAARLTEALVKLNNFAGLRDGMRLLREMVEQCWDRLYPPMEDGDVEVRAGPFYWLDDAERGARFPYTVRCAGLLKSENRAFSRQDWDLSKEGKGTVSREDFEKAIAAATLPDVQTAADDVAGARDEIGKLVKSLGAKMGPAAPALTALRQAVDDCQWLAQHILQRKRPAEAPAAEKSADGKPAAPARPASTRAEVYRQLSQAANVLRELEPHSPIPYLIQRAVDLGSLTFPDLIKELVRDAKIVGEMNRELGIKEPPAKK
jgi:type VI secretion system protein ImpA